MMISSLFVADSFSFLRKNERFCYSFIIIFFLLLLSLFFIIIVISCFAESVKARWFTTHSPFRDY